MMQNVTFSLQHVEQYDLLKSHDDPQKFSSEGHADPKISSSCRKPWVRCLETWFLFITDMNV